MKLAPASRYTLSLLIADTEQHGRAQPRTLQALLHDVYGPWMRQHGAFWLYVGTDGFTVARLKTGDVFTVQRLDLWSVQEAGGDVGDALERSLVLLALRHRRNLNTREYYRAAA